MVRLLLLRKFNCNVENLENGFSWKGSGGKEFDRRFFIIQSRERRKRTGKDRVEKKVKRHIWKYESRHI